MKTDNIDEANMIKNINEKRKALLVQAVNAENSVLISAFAVTALVLALGFISVFSYQYGWQWLDSDHSSEMILGKLLSKENVLVSKNWLYSTEIRLVYQTIFTMPLFKLFGHYENWALIRSLNILLNNLVFILSYMFLMKQVKIQTKWILISSFFLITPLSMEYWDIVTFGGYYIFFIAQFFCCLALFITLTCHDNTPKKTTVFFVLFTISSFLLGIQGIRSMFAFYVPLLIACMYMRLHKKVFLLFLGGYGFIACCAGYAVNSLLHFRYSFGFQMYQDARIDNLFANFIPKLSRNLAYLAGFFGLSDGSPVLSAQGLFSVAALIGTFVLLWIVFGILRKVRLQNDAKETEQGQQLIPVFFAVSVIFNIFIFVVTTYSIAERYFIPFMIFYIPLAAILFEYAEKTYSHLKRAVIVCAILLFIIGQSCLNFQNMVTRDFNTIRKGYIQYLLDNDLNFGFATHWNANVTTELTNGGIEIAGLDPRLSSGTGTNQLRIFGSLNPVKFFDPFYHNGESFLLLTRTEWDLVKKDSLFSGKKPDYTDDYFIIFRYPSAEIIYRNLLSI